jgi:hypothetical protein
VRHPSCDPRDRTRASSASTSSRMPTELRARSQHMTSFEARQCPFSVAHWILSGHPHTHFYLPTYSYPFAPPALDRWPSHAPRTAASEGKCSATGPAMRGARPPPSRDARLSALPGAACDCSLLVVRPLPPRRVARAMPLFHVVLPACRLQASPGRSLW